MGRAFKDVETIPELLAILFVAFVLYAVFKNADKIFGEVFYGSKKIYRNITNADRNLNIKIQDILRAYENSTIDPSRTIAYLGSLYSSLVIYSFNLRVSKREETYLDALFSAVLILQLFEVFKLNSLYELANPDYREQLKKEIINITFQENKSLSNILWDEHSIIFDNAIKVTQNKLSPYGRNLNAPIISGFIIDEIGIEKLDKYSLENVISDHLINFNNSTARRLKNIFSS